MKLLRIRFGKLLFAIIATLLLLMAASPQPSAIPSGKTVNMTVTAAILPLISVCLINLHPNAGLIEVFTQFWRDDTQTMRRSFAAYD